MPFVYSLSLSLEKSKNFEVIGEFRGGEMQSCYSFD